ncbi:hypothetical protein GW813_11765 [bacterium]|nr:hypothetical protein [bacterium]
MAPETLMLAGLGVAAATWLGLRRGHLSFGPAPRPGEFIRDGVFLILILVGGYLKGPGLRGSALVPALVSYPLFAVAQLLVMMILPATDLVRCGVSRRVTILACGMVFGALHWPNPVLVVATSVAMAFWTWDRLNGRGLISLALGMGLLGAVFSQTLPDTWTEHMRVGPGLIRQVAREDLAVGRLWFTPGTPEWNAHPPLPAEFLGTIYPGVVGRPIGPEEFDLWQSSLDRARRRTVIWQFISGAEYAGKQLHGPAPAPVGEAEEHALFWRKLIDRLDSPDYWEAHGGNWDGFLTGLYADLLGRRPALPELAAWSPRLHLIQRRQIAEVLLRHSLQWRDQPPQTLSMRSLVAPQIPLLVARFP